MRFGLRLIGYLGTSRELVRLARLAEEAGFDSVWFPHDTFMHNTWVLTTAVLPNRRFVLVRSRADTEEGAFKGDYHVILRIGNKALVSNQPSTIR